MNYSAIVKKNRCKYSEWDYKGIVSSQSVQQALEIQTLPQKGGVCCFKIPVYLKAIFDVEHAGMFLIAVTISTNVGN